MRALLLLLIAGCHEVVALEPPMPERDHRSLILFLPAGIWALDLDAPAYPNLSFRASMPEPIYALYFDRSLDQLGFITGWQEKSESGTNLPPADEQLAATIGGDALDWQPIASLPDEIALVRLESDLTCAQFQITDVTLDGVPGSGGRVIAPLGGDRFLFGSRDGKFFEVTRTSAMLVDTPTTTPHVAGFTDASGTVWLYGERGHIAKYRDGVFEDAGTTASRAGRGDLGDLEGSAALPPELFAVSHDGYIDRFDGSAWETLIDDPLGEHDSAGVAFVEPGLAVMIGPRNGIAIIYDHGAVREESTGESPLDFGLNSIAQVPALGTIVGTVRGGHLVRTDGGWSAVGNNPSANAIRALAPFRDGFISATINGFVTQYDPRIGFCESTQVAPNGITRILPNGDGFVILSLHETGMGDQPDVVSFVDPI